MMENNYFYQEETLAQVFLCEFFRKPFLAEHPATTSHMMLFFLFADQLGLHLKINLFGGAMVN